MRVRTGFSFRAAVGHLPEVMSRLMEIGATAAPISDRASTFGFERWTKLTKDSKLRPIYGVELAVVAELGSKRPTTDYWTFFATDSLRPLHDLVYLATSQSAAEPVLLYEQALCQDSLAKIAGERALWGKVPVKLMKRAVNLYVGLSPAISTGYFNSVSSLGLKWIATSSNFYPREEDREFYRVALGRHAEARTYPSHLLSDAEWGASLCDGATVAVRKAALKNRSLAMDLCRAELVRAEILTPKKPKTLRQMCLDGARRVKLDVVKNKTYAARLDRELAMIEEKKFEDYFYILAEMIGYAKTKMIVGPARGSSCGSLVCYLLDITTIDPIPFDLIFERFIDTTRADLPDVDVDFSDARRHLVFQHAEETYGRDHVARLGSVGSFQPKSALNQVATSLRIPDWKVSRVSDQVIRRAMGDSRASQTIEDTLDHTDAGRELCAEYPEVRIVSRMEDHPTNAGQHAAGLVITQRPVADHVAVDSRTGAIMADKKDAEDLNLLKIDALGLTQLSIFERCLELLGRDPTDRWLETLPLDDPGAFEVLNRQHFAGVFQFTGAAVRSSAERVHFDGIEDIIVITALSRPGPLASGGAYSWMERKAGREEVTYHHELLRPFLEDTLGICVYQEQVLKIGREVGDLSWEEVTKLRQAMSKSLGKEFFDQFGDKWKVNAIKKGLPEDVAGSFWDDMCQFGAWAFNRAHSVAYGMVSYWCCYLKAHHPVEFAAATLDAEADPAKQIALLRELSAEGISYRPVDPESSTDRWEIKKTADGVLLVGPLSSVKGLGPSFVREILTCRREGRPIRDALAKRLAAAKTPIDSLFPVRDAVAIACPDMEAAGIVSVPTAIRDARPGILGEVLVLAVVKKIDPRNENEPTLVAKRNGRRLQGPEMALNMWVMDDTDEIFCKIDRMDFEDKGRPVVERGKPGKAIYAIKGRVPRDFRMIRVSRMKYLGDLP